MAANLTDPDSYPSWMHEALLLPVNQSHIVQNYAGTDRTPALKLCRKFRAFRNSLRLNKNHPLAYIEAKYKLTTHVKIGEQGTRVYLIFRMESRELPADIQQMKLLLN